MKLKVFTAFSGYDSQCMALDRLAQRNPGFEYELVGWSEIDPYAIQAHNAVYPQYADRNYGDISKINWAEVPDFDLFTYSSPCQDFSQAGLQRGGEAGSGTRSSLLWECEKAITAKRPKYTLMENVAALVSQKFIKTFNKWQSVLGELGYDNFPQVLNAKDYGVPQNRERVFLISIRKDLGFGTYYFPQPYPLELRLKDVLEEQVAERYYLKEEQVKTLMNATKKHQEKGNGFAFKPHSPEDDYSYAVACSGKGGKTDNYIAEPTIASMKSRDKDNPTGVRTATNGNFAQRLEPSADQSTSNTITSVAKDNLLIEPSILTPVRTEYGKAIRKQYGDNNLPESRHNLTTLQPKQDGTSNTLTSVAKDNLLIEPKVQVVGNIHPDRKWQDTVIRQQNLVVGEEGISPCITELHSNHAFKIAQATKEGYAVVPEGGVFDANYPDSKTRRGRVQEGGTVSPTIMASQNELLRYEGIRIRRLTERELYRLMDVEEKDVDTLLAAPIPRTRHAKLAGNSIVVNCLYHIFDKLLCHPGNDSPQLTLFD